MLFFGGCFIYWLGIAVVEYFQFATWREVLVALPGMAVGLFMAALFNVPGMLMAFLKRRTLCNNAEGLIRQVRSYGVFRRARELRQSDVRQVVSIWKTTRHGSAEVHTVELVLADKQRVEVAQLGNWDSTLELGRQLAGYLDVDFHDTSG